MTSLDENPNCARTHATFRLVGDALNPAEVTAALAVSPTRALGKGAELPAGPRGEARRQRIGIWLLGTEDKLDSTSLDRHLIQLLDAIEPAAPALNTLRAEHDLRADFFCYWLSGTGHGGPEVSPATLARIAALDASLGIDFYGPFKDSD
jgi:hypothetical protein